MLVDKGQNSQFYQAVRRLEAVAGTWLGWNDRGLAGDASGGEATRIPVAGSTMTIARRVRLADGLPGDIPGES